MPALPPQPVDINGRPFSRGTSEQELDQWNRAMRASDLYQNFLKRIGKVDTGRGVTLSRSEQGQLQDILKSSGINIPRDDFQIDQGGNLNQGNRLKRNLGYAAAIGAGGYFAAPYIGSALGMGGGATVTGEGLGTGSLLAGEGGAAAMGGSAAGLTGAAGSGVLASGAAALPVGATAAAAGGGMNWTELAKLGLDIAGSYGAGRAQGRQAEAGINQSQDRNATDLYRAVIAANANQNDFNLGTYRTGVDATNAENQFGLSRYNADLGTANAKNQFGFGLHDAEIANAGLDLAQRKFALDAPGARAGNAVRGDILSRAQDATVSGVSSKIPVPQIAGGLRPSMFSADTRALGTNMTAQARSEQERGDKFAALPTLPTYTGPTGQLPDYKKPGAAPTYVPPPAPPSLTGLPQSNGLDTGLNIAGLGGAFLDFYNRYRQNKPAGATA